MLCTLLIWTSSVGATSPEDEADLALAYGDKSSVSIATGAVQPLRKAPSVASVITAEDIRALGASDLDDVLETVPGLHVSRSTQGYSPIYTIRGIHNDLNPQVLMLLNGNPMTVLLAGNRGLVWGGMPVENISRIEVIRGPGSALYGADAFAGVINVITKSSSEINGTQLGARIGSFDSHDAWWLHGGKLGAVDVAAYLRTGKTAGSRRLIESDAQTAFDGLFGSRASEAPGPLSAGRDAVDGSVDLTLDRWRLRLGYTERTHVGSVTGAASALDPTGRSNSRRLTADLGYQMNNWMPDWDLSVQLSSMNYRERSSLLLFPAGAFGGSFPEGMYGSPQKWESHTRVSLSTTYTGWRNHRIRLGAGYARESLYRVRESKNYLLGPGLPAYLGSVQDVSSTAPFILPTAREVMHAYAQDEWSLAQDWALTAGVRHDHYSDVGGTTNPRVALVWDAAFNLTAKLLYGRAFRAPAFAELYAINNPVALGSPTLKPETIETLEAALVWQPTPKVNVTAGAFQYRMRDIIRLSGNVVSNFGQQIGHGIELEWTWDVDRDWRLSGNFAKQQSTDKTTGQDAGDSPHYQLYGRADWRVTPGWLWSNQLNWVGGRKRVAGDDRPAIKDYLTVDATLSTQAARAGWGWSFSVRNLFNVDAREPSPFGRPFTSLPNDLPLPKRTFQIMATYPL